MKKLHKFSFAGTKDAQNLNSCCYDLAGYLLTDKKYSIFHYVFFSCRGKHLSFQSSLIWSVRLFARP